jgi:hypothetical protein
MSMLTPTTNLSCRRDRECSVDYVLLYGSKPFLKSQHAFGGIYICFQELDIETTDFDIHHFLFNILKGKMDNFFVLHMYSSQVFNKLCIVEYNHHYDMVHLWVDKNIMLVTWLHCAPHSLCIREPIPLVNISLGDK